MAQTTTVCRVVRVQPFGHEVAPVDGPVVGVPAWSVAGVAVVVLAWLVALAHRVLGEYLLAEEGAVLLVVAALGGCASAGVAGLGAVRAAATHRLLAAGARVECAGHPGQA